MGFRATNFQNESVLSVSRSMMNGRKGKSAPKKTIKCECSKCGEVSFIVESNLGTEHVSCLGMKLSPAAKAVGLRGKVKGTWESWKDPIKKKQIAMEGFMSENGEKLKILCELLNEAIGIQYLNQLREAKALEEQRNALWELGLGKDL